MPEDGVIEFSIVERSEIHGCQFLKRNFSPGTVESCLSHGLRRRALGLFKSSSTTALIQKIAKTYGPAGDVCKILADMEAGDSGRLAHIHVFIWPVSKPA